MARKGGAAVVVAAIDFGTTFSGYAFSFRHEFERDPLRVYSRAWVSGSRDVISLKTSTCVLFDRERRFHSFGFEAEDKYTDLSYDGEHNDWYYFRRFKMMLYSSSLSQAAVTAFWKDSGISTMSFQNTVTAAFTSCSHGILEGHRRYVTLQDVHRTTMLKDETGKEMPAMVVFSGAIKYLSEHLFKTLEELSYDMRKEDIKWVLTVPAICSDGAKQFTREAAEMAGIKRDLLLLACEPEAVVMFYKYFSATLKDRITCFSPHSKYVIVDAGDNTVNITAHEVQYNCTMHQVFKVITGPWGGTTVDKEFLLLLEKITGKQVMENIQEDSPFNYEDLLRRLEVNKKNVAPELMDKVQFRFPICLLEMYKKVTGYNLRAAIQDNPEFAGKITIVRNKLSVDPKIMKSLFKNTCEKIVHHLNGILTDPRAKGTDTILMVGQFSESPMLRDAVKTAFRHMRVICPPEPQSDMLHGAVIFGHDSDRITQRISKYAYEIQMSGNVDPSCHPESIKGFKDGTLHVRRHFHKLLKVGQPISEGKSRKTKTTANEQAGLISDDIPNPSSQAIGELSINCRCGETATVTVMYDGTEIELRTQDQNHRFSLPN